MILLAGLLIPLLLPWAALAQAPVWSFEAGQQFGIPFQESPDGHALSRNRWYLFPSLEFAPELGAGGASSLTFRGAGRAWLDIQSEAELRELSADASLGDWRFKVGWQEIAWGETFGVYIADVVHPRDLRDPFFNEPAWFRLPVFAAQAQWFSGPLTLQVILVPVSRQNRLPDRGGAFDPLGPLFSDVPIGALPHYGLGDFRDHAEFGARASVLFPSGLDLGFFYYRHHNRNPVFELSNDGQRVVLAPVLRVVDTLGLSFSQAFGDVVLRGDSVLHDGLPMNSDGFTAPVESAQWRTILGADVVFADDWSAGTQFHADAWDYSAPSGWGIGHWNETLYWSSLRVGYRMLQAKLEPEFFVFQGIDNSDQWVRPRVTWNATASMRVSVSADFFSGAESLGSDSRGLLGRYAERDRVFTWVSYHF